MLVYNEAFIFPSKMHIPHRPQRLIPADVNFHRMLSPAGREISSNVLYVEHRATALVNYTSRT